MNRATTILACALLVTAALPTVASTDHALVVCETPSDDPACAYETIQDAVDDAEPGDTVHVRAGTYVENVDVTTPEITLTGDGPSATVLDGEDADPGHGVYVNGADDVTVEDLTVQNYEDGFGVYYTSVTGFHVENVHALDNGDYGIYAYESSEGTFQDSTSKGHGDGGFYIGSTLECNCLIDNVHAEDNLVGYSGTSASHITIQDSTFTGNAAGVVPNVLPDQLYPQTDLTVQNNHIVDNNNHERSQQHHVSGMHVPGGVGVIIAGGINNVVADNTITGHDRAGVAMVWLFTEPAGNQIVDNTLDNGDDEGPDALDLIPEDPLDVLWDAGGVNNCFQGNQRLDGAPVTFDAGPAWNTLGTLPDCQTPNAGPPTPDTLARELSLLIFGCEPSHHASEDTSLLTEDGCHQDMA